MTRRESVCAVEANTARLVLVSLVQRKQQRIWGPFSKDRHFLAGWLAGGLVVLAIHVAHHCLWNLRSLSALALR